MDTSAFHFANNVWLWGLAVIPVVVLFYAIFYRASASRAKLERFADKHLLPHLLAGKGDSQHKIRRSMLLWSLLWACGIVAMAGPRWNYTDVDTFKPQQDMVVVLDLSKSMDAQDVKPSRIALARTQIDDLIKQAPGLNVGLVAYAADAHMVSPITDDTKAVLDTVPYLDTTLPYVQGNTIKSALSMASRMLDSEPGNNKSILVLSNGDFTDKDIPSMVKETVGKDTAIYTLGVGTPQGAPVPADNGGWVKDDNGTMVVSHLQAETLKELSAERGGIYATADYSDNGIHQIVNSIKGRDKTAEVANQKIRDWEEHFTLLLIAMALLMLPWFRKGQVFPVLACVAALTLAPGAARAEGLQDYFLNKPQQAQEAFNAKEYKKAEAAFDTPYRRGVAQYKAGEFASAEKSFAEAPSSMPAAQYNLGNAQTMDGKYADAIANYESVLKREPANAKAKHNLEIARKLLEQQQQQDKKQAQNKNQKDKDKSSSQNQPGNSKDGNGQQQADKQPSPEQQSTQNKDQKDKKNASQAQSAKDSSANGQKPADQQAKATQGNPQPSEEKKQAASQPPAPQSGQRNAQASAEQKPEPEGNAENGKDNAMQTKMAADQQLHPRTQKDIDADQWLNRIDNDPKSFLRNQFMIESEVNGTQQGVQQ